MALSLELSGILWWNFAYTLILTRCTPLDCQMTFEIGWDFAEVKILKKVTLLQNDIYHRSRLCRAPNSEKVKMALSLELSGILWWHFAYTMIYLVSSLQMTLRKACSDTKMFPRLPRGSNPTIWHLRPVCALTTRLPCFFFFFFFFFCCCCCLLLLLFVLFFFVFMLLFLLLLLLSFVFF